MTDNTVLDALESINQTRIDEPGFAVAHYRNVKKIVKALPIYKAEREVVEAAVELWRSYDEEPAPIAVLNEGRLEKAIDNLKEVRREN